jgi:HTH-type transcriptional regulator/antitoxin MqsA
MEHSQKRCPICGETAVGLTREPLLVEFRDCSYEVQGFEYERCGACGEESFGAGQVDAIQSAAVALARAERGLLTPDEIRSLRRDLHLTQSRLEEFLGVGPKTVTRWEKGTVFQGRSADRLMRLVWRDPRLLVELESPSALDCGLGLSDWVVAGDPQPVRQEMGQNAYALAA